MNPVIEAVLYGLQVIVLQGMAAPAISQLSYRQALKKNRQWVDEHPQFLKQNPSPSVAPHRVIGAVLLMIICAGLFTDNPLPFSFTAHVVSILVLAGNYVFIDLWRNRRIMREIPAPQVRRASLSPRDIANYVSRTAFLALLALGALNVVCWTFVAYRNLKLVYPAILDCAGLLSCLATVVYVIKRKPTIDDTEAFESFRRSEANGALIIFSAFLLISSTQLIGSFYDIKLFKDVYLILSDLFTLLLTGGLMVFLTSKSYREMVK